MSSSLRVRTRQSFGFGATGSAYQHCYELAHMARNSEIEDIDNSDESESWSDDLEERFLRDVTGPIYLVEKMNLHFSDQFCYRLSWPDTPGSSNFFKF